MTIGYYPKEIPAGPKWGRVLSQNVTRSSPQPKAKSTKPTAAPQRKAQKKKQRTLAVGAPLPTAAAPGDCSAGPVARAVASDSGVMELCSPGSAGVRRAWSWAGKPPARNG